MIYASRSANINHGKWAQTFEWAVKVAVYLNEKHGTDTQVVRNVTGPGQQVHWLTSYDSLAAYEATGAEIFADEGYQALIAELREQELIGEWEDHLYATVP